MTDGRDEPERAEPTDWTADDLAAVRRLWHRLRIVHGDGPATKLTEHRRQMRRGLSLLSDEIERAFPDTADDAPA